MPQHLSASSGPPNRDVLSSNDPWPNHAGAHTKCQSRCWCRSSSFAWYNSLLSNAFLQNRKEKHVCPLLNIDRKPVVPQSTNPPQFIPPQFIPPYVILAPAPSHPCSDFHPPDLGAPLFAHVAPANIAVADRAPRKVSHTTGGQATHCLPLPNLLHTGHLPFRPGLIETPIH